MLSMKHDKMKEAMKPVVCNWLRRYRSQNRLTQEQMARAFMISGRSYSDLEHGICCPSGLTFAMFLTFLSKEEQKEFLSDIRAGIEKVR